MLYFSVMNDDLTTHDEDMKRLNQFSVLTDFWTTLTSNFSPFEEMYIPTPSFMSYSNWPVKEAPERAEQYVHPSMVA